MTSLRGRLTYSNVIATLALFLALGGGAYAATQLKKNSVGTKQLKNGAVTQTKISKSAQKALKGQAGAPGPAGPSGIGPGFRSAHLGKVPIPSTTPNTPTTIVTLAGLPAGSYAITAKTMLVDDSFADSQFANCRLSAPSEGAGSSDSARVLMGQKEIGDSPYASLPLQVTHTFPGDGGSARITCYHENPTPIEAEDSSIQAVRVSTLSEVTVFG